MYKEKLKTLEELLIKRDEANDKWKHDNKTAGSSYCINTYRGELNIDYVNFYNTIFIFKSREICEKFFTDNFDKLNLIKEFI